MSAELLVWGINHKGNGGFNTALFESEITPIDVQDSVSYSDLREDKIIQEDSSRFYSVSLSANHRIYSIYTYSKDHQERNGFTAISIYTNKNKVLSNVFVSLNKAIELYLDKRDSIYPNMFEEILDNMEEFQNYNTDENKSSGTSCFYATGENSLKYFLDNSNTQQYQKVYATHDNGKIKEKYPVYSSQKKPQSINTPLNSRNSNKTTYIYIIVSIFLLISMGWFISTLFNNNSGGGDGGDGGRSKGPNNQPPIENIDFGDYEIQFDSLSENYNWFHEQHGNKVTEMSKRILLIEDNEEILLKNDYDEVLKNLKSAIQKKLVSKDGVQISLYKDNDTFKFPENLSELQKLKSDEELIYIKIRYNYTGDFEKIVEKDVWKYEEVIDSLCKKRIFKYYLEGIDILIRTPDDTKQNLNPENKDNAKELQNNSEKSSDENNIPTPQKKKPKCTKHNKVNVKELGTEPSAEDIEKEWKKLGNCIKCIEKKNDLSELKD